MTEPRDDLGLEEGAGYSKDYWDIVFDQLKKRRLFKLALAVLALLYASAIYAPLLANDRPFVLEAINYKEYELALKTLYPATVGLRSKVRQTPDEFLAKGADELGRRLEPETCDRLLRLAALLVVWGERFNLTAHRSP